jgi:hypothetical protein
MMWLLIGAIVIVAARTGFFQALFQYVIWYAMLILIFMWLVGLGPFAS